MGIERNRRISDYRVAKHRERKNKILIAVEGTNKTEKNYFNNFEKRTKRYNISYARGNETDPMKLVKSLEKEISKNDLDLSNGDMAFCVFDVDMNPNKNKIINDAKKYAEDRGIQIITSTPCIELWFLLHYCYTTANLSNDEVIDRLKQYFPKYAKNINIYPELINNVNEAIDRAIKLEKYQVNNGNQIGTVEANPCTEIYKLVEYLMKNG